MACFKVTYSFEFDPTMNYCTAVACTCVPTTIMHKAVIHIIVVCVLYSTIILHITVCKHRFVVRKLLYTYTVAAVYMTLDGRNSYVLSERLARILPRSRTTHHTDS